MEGIELKHEQQTHQNDLKLRIVELQRELEQSEISRAKYFDLYDRAPVGFLTLDEQGVILEANLTAAALLCMAVDALVMHPLSNFILPDDRDSYVLKQKLCRETGVGRDWETRLVRPDGSSFWVQCQFADAPAATSAPGIYHITLTVIDQRKQFEAEMIRDKALLRCIIDSVGDLIYIKDRNGVYRACNKASEAFIGLPESEQIGKTDFDFFDADIARVIREFDQHILSSGKESRVEEWVTYLDGSRGLLDSLKAPYYGPDGEQLGLVGISRDITERKRAEEALLQAHDELEQRVAERTHSLQTALRELESFSYTISHDLRAPLRHINSHLAILTEDFGDLLPPKALRLLDRTRSASQRMSDLIDDILELARVSRTHLMKKSINLSDLATLVCNSLKEAEPHRTVEFKICDGLAAQGDKPLLMQVLVNLFGNAWKYTSQNSEARIEFGKVVDAGRDNFYVKDNGVGFDMAYADKLFDEFQRLHGSEFEGNGIGLATVKRIIDRHGGKVWAESKPGAGATFYFTMP